MSTIIRTSIWCIAILVVLLSGVVTYLRIADLSIFEEQIERFLSKTIGHTLDVGGSFELHFGRLTELTAAQITLTNDGWQPDPVIANIGHFSVSVDLWSLIFGPIVVEDLDIRDVRIRLERNDEYQANWTSANARNQSETDSGFDRELIAFREVRVQNFKLVYLDPARRRPLNVALIKVTVSPDENHVLDLDLNGTINDLPFLIDGRLGPWENLIDGRDIAANIEMNLARVRMTLEGTVEDLPKLGGAELSLNISGPAIDRVADRLGLPPFAEGSFRLDGRIRKLDVGSQLSLNGNLGAIDVFASGIADNLVKLRRGRMSFSFAGPDTKYVAEVLGIDGAPALPFAVSGEVEKDGTKVMFSGTQAQLGNNVLRADGWLDFRNGIPDGDLKVSAVGPDFSVTGPFVKVQGMPAEAFEIVGRIVKTASSLSFDEVNVIVGDNRIAANGAIGRRGDSDTRINFNASGPDISIFGPMTGLGGLKARAFDISANIEPDSAGIRIGNAKGDFGDIQIVANGVIGTTEGFAGTDLTINASGTDLRYVALLAGVPYLPERPFKIGARARIDGNRLRLSHGIADIGRMNGAVSGTVSLGRNAGEFEFDLSVSGPDVADALQFEWLDRMSGEAFKMSGRIKHRSGRYELNAINATVSDFAINIDGEVASVDASGNIALKATAPDAKELRKLLGLSSLPKGQVSLGGRIEKRDDELKFRDLLANIGEYSVRVDGLLSTSPMSNRSDLRFSGSGPDLHQIGLIFDYGEFPARPFKLSGQVNGIPTGFALERFVARIGDNDIVGGFTVDLRGKPEVSGNLTSSFLDLTRQPIGEYAAAVDSVSAGNGFLFSDEPLEADWLAAANVDIDVKTDRLILGFGDVQDFRIGVRLRDAVLDIDPISFRETGGRLSGKLRLKAADGRHSLGLLTEIENMHIGLLAAKDQVRATVPAFAGRIEFEGSGRSLHDIMASSNGKLSLTQGGGRMKDLMSSRLFGDLVLQMIRTLNPLQAAEKYTTLQCAAYVVNIADGLATIETLALQSDRMAFVAKGSVNFKDEKLNLAMRATPREGVGISLGGVANSFFRLGGTLREPQLQLDPTASVATTGAAVATGGLSIVAKSLWDRVRAQTDICKDLGKGEVGK